MNSPKHTNAVKLLLNDRELLDLSRLANADNRPLGEMVRVVLRRYMYGACQPAGAANNSNHGAHEGLSGTEWADTRVESA